MEKKKYVKPVVKKVKLAMDEAVLSQCKAFAGEPSGKGNKSCGHPQCKTTYGS